MMRNCQERCPPAADEYDEHYRRYVSLVPEGDVIDVLKEQLVSSVELFSNLPEEKLAYRYAPDKWTTKEVVGHVIDVEWVLTCRALRFARGDATPLAGVDADKFMAGANFGERTMESLVAEYRHLRSANTVLFSSFSEAILDRAGMALDYRFTVRSILYLIAGHELHHVGVLKERYL